MNNLFEEYETRLGYVDEPSWLYHKIPFFQKIWLSPVYQRRLYTHIWHQINSQVPLWLWPTVAFIVVIVLIFGFIVPVFMALPIIALLGLIFLPTLYRFFIAIFLKLPLRFQSLTSTDNPESVCITPLDNIEIFDAEIMFALLQEAKMYNTVTRAFWWSLLITIPMMFSFFGSSLSNAIIFFGGVTGAVIASVAILTIFASFLAMAAYISAMFSTFLAPLMSAVASIVAVTLLLILYFTIAVLMLIPAFSFGFNGVNDPGIGFFILMGLILTGLAVIFLTASINIARFVFGKIRRK